MADRVHPTADSTPVSVPSKQPPEHTSIPVKSDPSSMPEKPAPPPGTYVVQVPKDQVYRYPPKENARRFQEAASRKNRRTSCCCCLSWICGLLLLLILLIAIAAGVFYLVFRPRIPKYSVENLSVKGFNLSSTDLTLSPEFDVTVRAENPNKRIGIYYVKGSSVLVSYSGVELCTGRLPIFYQGTRNVTVFETVLSSDGIHLSSVAQSNLLAQQRRGQIPLDLDLSVPVKIKVGSVKTWKITVKVRCDLTVDRLTENSKIVSKTCKVKVNL